MKAMLRSVILAVKSTHRHPANRALHVAGAPAYVAGAAMVAGHLLNMGTDALPGAILWSAAIAMFVAGHAIEGNVMSMTPVLVARLAKRS
jgi:hypothetical protein